MSSRGFTLVEVLVALALFSIGVVALVKMQVTSTRGTGLNRELVVATVLAQKKMEELKGMVYSSVAPDAAGAEDHLAGITYTTTCTMNEFGTAPGRYKTVTVTVTWKGKRITITSIVSEV